MIHASNLIRMVGLTLAGMALAAGTHAQPFPNKPIIIIQPYSAGGLLDMGSRIMSVHAEKLLGQRIVVENRTGGGGKVGTEAMLRAPRDGYTLAAVSSSLAVYSPLLDATFKFEPVKDYTPITLAFDTYYVLAASPTAPFNSLAGLIAYAKSNPGKLSVGNAGDGTGGHLAFELFKQAAGFDATAIPFKGEGPLIPSIVGGQVPVGYTTGTVRPLVEAGKLVALATTGPTRWKLFPNAPTFKEANISPLAVSALLGFIGPPGMPNDVVARINAAMVASLQVPEVRKTLEEAGAVVRGVGPEEFAAQIRSDLDGWGAVIRKANIKIN